MASNTEQPTYSYTARWDGDVVLHLTQSYTREQCADLNNLLERWTERVAKEVSRPFASPDIAYESVLPPATSEG